MLFEILTVSVYISSNPSIDFLLFVLNGNINRKSHTNQHFQFSFYLTHQCFRDANSRWKVPKSQGHENLVKYKGQYTTNRTNRANSSFLIFGKEKGRRNRDEFFIAIFMNNT